MNPSESCRSSLTVVVACALLAGNAIAQNTSPGGASKTEKEGEKVWEKTKEGAEKAWDATKGTTEKAVKATEKGAGAAGRAVGDVAGDAADTTRKVGDKIGQEIPGTVQNEAARKP